MSRTHRTHLEWRMRAHGRFWTWAEERACLESIGWTHWSRLGWKGEYFVDRNGRDSKPWDKPPKWFKQMRRREERARAKQALLLGKDILAVPKSDQWLWT